MQESLQLVVFGVTKILRRFLSPKGRLGVVWGSFGGRSGIISGRSVVAPGPFQGRSGVVLGPMGVVRGRSRVIRGSFGTRSEVVRQSFGVRSKIFRKFFRKIFENNSKKFRNLLCYLAPPQLSDFLLHGGLKST